MAENYKVKSASKGNEWKDGMFWVNMELEGYPNKVSMLAKSMPNAGDTLFGNIEHENKNGRDNYRFKKEKQTTFSGNGGGYNSEKREAEKKESDNNMLISFVTKYATRLVEAGIIPFYQGNNGKSYSINDLSLDILNTIIEQEVPISLKERSTFMSYAIDIYLAYVNDESDDSKPKEKKCQLPPKIVQVNDVQDGFVKPNKVFAIYRGLVMNAKKLKEKLN